MPGSALYDFGDMERTAETAAINDAVATLLTSFAGRGSKMIVYHGSSDPQDGNAAPDRAQGRLTPLTSAGRPRWQAQHEACIGQG